MKKKQIIITLVVIVFFCLFPIPSHYKDGGTVKYQAVLYSITDYHALRGIDGFETGFEIKILGITVYKNTTFEQ